MRLYFEKKESHAKWFSTLKSVTKQQQITNFYEEHHSPLLGKGKSSEVYKGVNLEDRREVAIKRIRISNKNETSSFL
jgi:hypothetical protein